MKHELPLFILLVSIAFGLALKTAHGDLIVDVDPITPGIQSSLSVVSGSSVTVLTYYAPPGTGPLPFNAVGVDLNWTGLGLGAAAPTTPALIGSFGGLGPFVVDLISGAPILFPGTPLISAGLPPVGAFSVGGVGFSDTSASFFTVGGPIPFPVDLFGVTFTVSGSVGDSVTFLPTGILVPSVGASPGSGPFVPGGDPFQFLPGGPTATLSDASIGGTITIIPEPHVVLYVILGLGLICWRRQNAALKQAGSSLDI